ncbi:MAG: hypothetical protein HFI39_01325 [Lachnospiraceae bacterium]|nr:hypothetical protein [Lachnospiraceae bacterium]
MANRRMFSLDVVDTDAFLDLPISSQALYFHLGMRADDDGFVSSPKRVTAMIGANQDDLKLLIAKGFAICLKNGIVVIRHWKQNNYIQRDRYKGTIYQEDLALLSVENGVYKEGASKMDTFCIQDVSTGKYSIDNNILCSPDGEREREKEENPLLEPDKKTALVQDKEDFEKIYGIFPKKRGRTRAFEYYRAYVGKGRIIGGTRYRLAKRQIYLAVASYVQQMEEAGTELQFYQNFSTFMNKTILDYLPQEGEHDI